MTWEVGSTDQQRMRAGFAVLSIGAAVLLFTWGMAVMRGPQTEGEVAARHEKLDPPSPPDQIFFAKLATGMLIYGSVLFIVLLGSVIALIRISRRYRQNLVRRPARRTPTSDVWRMHKVPNLPDDKGEPDAPT